MRTTAPDKLQRGRRVPSFARLHSFARLGTLALVSFLAACAPSHGTIGAVIAQDDQSGRLFVRDVPPDLAAAKAGVQRGDEILLIDGLDVRPMNPHQIHAALSGDVDATVKLTIVRGNDRIIRVTIKRTEARKLVKHLPMTD